MAESDSKPSGTAFPRRPEIPNSVQVAYLVSWVLFYVVVWQIYNPTISQDFLLVYFGLSSTLAAAVWAVYRTAVRVDGIVVTATLFFTLAAAAAAPSLILVAGPFRNTWLTISIASILTGLVVLFSDGLLAWYHATR